MRLFAQVQLLTQSGSYERGYNIHEILNKLDWLTPQNVYCICLTHSIVYAADFQVQRDVLLLPTVSTMVGFGFSGWETQTK